MAIFKDISVTFKPHPLTGDVSTVSDAKCVGQSIRNIVLTNMYERPFSSQEIAGNITSYLFEPFTPAIARDIEDQLLTAIVDNEPRCIIDRIDVEEDLVNYQLSVTVQYTIKTTDISDKITVFLQRV